MEQSLLSRGTLAHVDIGGLLGSRIAGWKAGSWTENGGGELIVASAAGETAAA